MIVCVCRRISDREIARHARASKGFDEIQVELGVAPQYGRYEGSARDVVAQYSCNCPSANMSFAADLANGPSWLTQAC